MKPAFILLLLMTAPAWGAPTYLNAGHAQSTTLTVTIAPTTGYTLLMQWYGYTDGDYSVTTSTGGAATVTASLTPVISPHDIGPVQMALVPGVM
jgi:hypothetical protein